MIGIGGINRDIAKLQKSIGGTNRKITRELNTAINQTVRKASRLSTQEITQELAVAQKVVKEKIAVKKSKHTELRAVVTIQESRRIPLKDFKAKQNKRGVAYKISKRKGRNTIPGAFIVDKFGGNVFKRTNDSRGPLQSFRGASPWGVFRKQRSKKKVEKQVQKELRKQIQRRIRFIELKKSGAI